MNKFCRVFETEKYGQILARCDRDENGEPAIVISILGGEPFDICSLNIVFTSSDTETAWNNRSNFLEWLDMEKAVEYAYVITDMTTKLDPSTRETDNVTEH